MKRFDFADLLSKTTIIKTIEHLFKSGDKDFIKFALFHYPEIVAEIMVKENDVRTLQSLSN